MKESDILRELFDDKIIDIINLFMKSPEKQFYLTEVSNLSKVNVTTTFRILNRMIKQGFIKSKIIGKVRLYQLERNDKTLALSRFIKKDDTPLQRFIDKATAHPRVKRIILESQDSSDAKMMIVGDFLPREKIIKLCKDIKDKHNFNIQFVEINENQFKGLSEFKSYDLDSKTIWSRSDSSNAVESFD